MNENIKKQLRKIRIAVNDLASPLPDPERLLTKYWTHPFRHLTGHQLKLIITMVVEEAKISRQVGLFIRPQDLEKEMIFWFAFVDQVGPNNIRNSDWNKIWRLASDARLNLFAELNEYYFNLIKNSKPKITSANTAFKCHLEAVQSRILSCIFDNKFPLA